MAANVSVQTMVNLMTRSRVTTAELAREALKKWTAEAKDVDDAEKFRRFLVVKGFATEYQATLLAHGKNEGYFIADYKILERIGQGRMAGVYRAQTPAGETVALKVLPPSKAKDPQLLGRFQREARLATQMVHPNIVRTLAVGQFGDLQFLVMEHLEGETFDEVLQRRRQLPVADAVHVIHQALLGLQHIHEKGFVHRDLKPANLMLVPGVVPGQPDSTLASTVKILDIGLGRETFEEATAALPADQLTGEGVILGTPDYLAPEQARDARNVDIRADIYSLGCVLYHALSGQPPFPDKSVLNQMIRHAKEEARPLHEFSAEIPDGVQQIVSFLMAKDAAQRYPTPERAAKALQMFLPSSPSSAPAATPNAAAKKRSENEKPLPATGTAPPEARDATVKEPARREAREPKKPVAPAAAPLPAATQPAPASPPGEFDVELVAIPIPPQKPVKPRLPADQRPLYDLDRRDFIMMAVGMGGTLAAIATAIGLARLMRRRPEDRPPPE